MGLAEQLLDAKKAFDATARARATAEAQQEMARKRVTEVEQEMTALGVTPETAEAEIRALHERVQTELKQLDQQLLAERTVYQQVAEAAKA